jgi:hypothetical protein
VGFGLLRRHLSLNHIPQHQRPIQGLEKMRLAMMRLTIPALAAIVLVVAMVMMRWPSTSVELAAGTAAMPSLQELHATAGIYNLPVQEIDDQALVYTAQGKR